MTLSLGLTACGGSTGVPAAHTVEGASQSSRCPVGWGEPERALREADRLYAASHLERALSCYTQVLAMIPEDGDARLHARFFRAKARTHLRRWAEAAADFGELARARRPYYAFLTLTWLEEVILHVPEEPALLEALRLVPLGPEGPRAYEMLARPGGSCLLVAFGRAHLRHGNAGTALRYLSLVHGGPCAESAFELRDSAARHRGHN
ncbi:MAG: hypothetical protein AB8I08_18645 [Sandaracinaceae bacterium]